MSSAGPLPCGGGLFCRCLDQCLVQPVSRCMGALWRCCRDFCLQPLWSAVVCIGKALNRWGHGARTRLGHSLPVATAPSPLPLLDKCMLSLWFISPPHMTQICPAAHRALLVRNWGLRVVLLPIRGKCAPGRHLVCIPPVRAPHCPGHRAGSHRCVAACVPAGGWSNTNLAPPLLPFPPSLARTQPL